MNRKNVVLIFGFSPRFVAAKRVSKKNKKFETREYSFPRSFLLILSVIDRFAVSVVIMTMLILESYLIYFSISLYYACRGGIADGWWWWVWVTTMVTMKIGSGACCIDWMNEGIWMNQSVDERCVQWIEMRRQLSTFFFILHAWLSFFFSLFSHLLVFSFVLLSFCLSSVSVHSQEVQESSFIISFIVFFFLFLNPFSFCWWFCWFEIQKKKQMHTHLGLLSILWMIAHHRRKQL